MTNKDESKKNDSVNSELLKMMIDEILQIQYARKKGIKIPDESVFLAVDDIKRRNSLSDEMFRSLLKQENLTFEKYQQKIKDQMLISRIVNQEVKSRILVESEESENYYKENINSFMVPESVNVRHILFLVKDGSDEELVKNKAYEILEKVKNGADFIDMAKTYSEGPTKTSGGEIGFFKRGSMVPEFEEVAFSLDAGKISDLVKTKFGYHIIKVIEKRDQRAKPFEEVKEDIQKKIFEEKAKKKYTEWINELRHNAYVDVLLTF